MISKETLLETFWADVHVAENTLDQAIGRIRKALEDDPERPKFIQTVPRQGYRFIGLMDAGGAQSRGDAFDQWMKGRLSLEALNAEQLHEATAAFERVLAANQNYAPAHTALANAYFLQYELTRPENMSNRALLECALTHARQACVLDPSSGEAWATFGFVLTSMGEVAEARAAARRATALPPSSWRHQFRLSMASWGQVRSRLYCDFIARERAVSLPLAPVLRRSLPACPVPYANQLRSQLRSVDKRLPSCDR